jgi:Glucose / Sorbosone dehydrogenase
VRRVGLIGLLMAAAWSPAASAAGDSLEAIGKFDQPIYVTSDPGNPNRLFVVEREGSVVLLEGATRSVFAELRGLVACCEGERGLLSIALPADFDRTGRFYADYTGTPAAGGNQGDIHVDAFRSSGGGLVREPIISIGHSQYDNHNGGQLQFGPEGDLYISVGDGGGGGDPLGSGQSTETLLGKILRIEPRPGQVPSYGIPPGNPFASGPGRDEIWSYGLRNPWRFSFDRATGDLVIGDVGQDEREEIDFEPRPSPGVASGGGANYGWNCREGFLAYVGAPKSCEGVGGFTEPVFDYPHVDPGNGGAHGCAITGGYVVRDPSLVDLYGRYIYADFCAGELRSLALPASGGEIASGDRFEGLTVSHPTSFGEDSCGRLYVTSNSGPVYRLVGAAPSECPVPSAGEQVGGRRTVRLRLRASLRGRPPRESLVLTARAIPCEGQQGRRVRLVRGGRPHGAKPLNPRCVVRFRLEVSHRSSFRAVLLAESGAPSARSRRVVVRPRR